MVADKFVNEMTQDVIPMIANILTGTPELCQRHQEIPGSYAAGISTGQFHRPEPVRFVQ